MICFVSNFLGAKRIYLNLGLGVSDAINDFDHLAKKLLHFTIDKLSSLRLDSKKTSM